MKYAFILLAGFSFACQPVSNTQKTDYKKIPATSESNDVEAKNPTKVDEADDDKTAPGANSSTTTNIPSTDTTVSIPKPTPSKIKLPDFCANIKAPGTWHSEHAFYGADGKLNYPFDAEKNRIVDFSYAGYHYGSEDLPNYPVVASIGPVAGDNTKNIQDALDTLAKKTPDANGIRGALLLKPGKYNVLGTIIVQANGLVLRGSGNGNDPSKDSIIVADKDVPHQRTVLIVGNNKTGNWKPVGNPVEITDSFVPVGSNSFTVKDASGFKQDAMIQIKHPSTQKWIDALKGGGPIKEAPWAPGSTDIIYNRRIVSISDRKITVDAPLFNHLDSKLSVATVSNVSDEAVVRESGIENLRVDIVTAGGEDENHAWNAIGVVGAQDSWVKDTVSLHFGQAGVFTREALRITVKGTDTLEPVGIRTGERFYNYNTAAMSQLILFTQCAAKDGRHNFISNGVQTTSGIVWYKCSSDGDSASEGHRRWSQALLFDSITEKSSGAIGIFNRADMGTSHGWGSAHSVIWNYNGKTVNQKPPTAQNYVVSSNAKNTPRDGDPMGSVEIKPGTLSPSSLYEAQLCERLQR